MNSIKIFLFISIIVSVSFIIGCEVDISNSISDSVPEEYLEFSEEIFNIAIKEERSLMKNIDKYNTVYYEEKNKGFLGLNIYTNQSFNRECQSNNMNTDMLEYVDKLLPILRRVINNPEIKSPENYIVQIKFKIYITEEFLKMNILHKKEKSSEPNKFEYQRRVLQTNFNRKDLLDRKKIEFNNVDI